MREDCRVRRCADVARSPWAAGHIATESHSGSTSTPSIAIRRCAVPGRQRSLLPATCGPGTAVDACRAVEHAQSPSSMTEVMSALACVSSGLDRIARRPVRGRPRTGFERLSLRTEHLRRSSRRHDRGHTLGVGVRATRGLRSSDPGTIAARASGRWVRRSGSRSPTTTADDHGRATIADGGYEEAWRNVLLQSWRTRNPAYSSMSITNRSSAPSSARTRFGGTAHTPTSSRSG